MNPCEKSTIVFLPRYAALRGADRRKRGQDGARLLQTQLTTQKFELLEDSIGDHSLIRRDP